MNRLEIAKTNERWAIYTNNDNSLEIRNEHKVADQHDCGMSLNQE